jgi:hypothetical protein
MGDTDTWIGYGDSYDPLDYGQDQQDNYYYKPRPVTCKNCGTEGLHWTSYKGKWYLFNEKSQQHVCEKRKQDAAEAFRHLF